jgi:fatty-acyl-CoA synthase
LLEQIDMIEDQIYIHRLLRALQGAGQATVLRYRDQDVSGDMLRGLMFQYARVLRDMDIGRGKLLAMFAPNRPEALAMRYAAHVIGAATVYLSIPASEAQRKALVEQMAPDLLVVFSETARCLDPKTGVAFATFGFDQAGSKGRLDAVAASIAPAPLPVAAHADDLGVIASSGGSTGVPKGSCRSFATYSAMVSAPSPKDRVQLINGPLAYLSQVLVDITLLGGGRVVLRDAYDTADTLVTIEAEKITDLFLVEPQLFELMDHPELGSYDLSSLRSLTHVGASAPKSLRLRARRRLGPILTHVYGASEMGIVSVLAPGEHDLSCPDLFTSAGRVQLGVDVRFRHLDESLAEAGEAGTIEVRSGAMASGYRHNPALTARSFRDGWYVTGDLGRLDEGGCLHVIGRAVDMQEVGGRLVAPTDIEEALCRLPAVRYAVAVVDPVSRLVTAAVVAWPGLKVEDRSCRHAIEEHFGAGFASSVLIVPVERVPLTEQGKPDRTAIGQLAQRPAAA